MTVVAGTEYCPAVLATAIKTGNFPLTMSGVHMSMMATMMVNGGVVNICR